MSSGREFVDYAVELLGPFGTVAARRMFGGYGIFLDDLMFAIVHDDMLWFKTDEMNRGVFEAAGSEPFSYARSGKTATLGFHRAPADALDSPAAAMPWARSAYAAALRARGRRQDHSSELALAPFVNLPAGRPRTTPKARVARAVATATKKTAVGVKRPTARRVVGPRNRTR